MTRRFNVGIVGARRGTGHILPFSTITETEVAALCDLNEETLHTVATAHGIAKQFTDYEKLLEDDDIQIIVLATSRKSSRVTNHRGVKCRKACNQ